MSLLLLFHPGVSGGPTPPPVTPPTGGQAEFGGFIGRARLERARLKRRRKDEEISMAVAAFLAMMEDQDGR